MATWISSALLAAASLFTVSVDAADGVYRLRLQVDRNGIDVVDTAVDVESGTDADVRLIEANSGAAQAAIDANTSLRIIAKVKRADEIGSDVAVNLQYFEKVADSWVLLGEPAIVAALDEQSSVAFVAGVAQDSRPNQYKISMTIGKNSRDQHALTAVELR
jgi:hypothetical protein